MKAVIDITPQPNNTLRRKRVAAYARVSSGKDAMLHSLKAQIDYYYTFITSNPEWEFVGIYADEAKTGTKENREQFQEMLSQCRSGNIDMIVTKAVSRFSRNTVTLLKAVRELQNLGIDVYFEEQNIHTMSTDGELLLTLLASFAQAESLSASDNQKWRIRKGFEEGKPTAIEMLGYRVVDDEFHIVPEEAAVVSRIFELYLDGNGLVKTANILNEEGLRTRKGAEWSGSKVKAILCNEKYAGDLLLQKSFILDHISKKKTPNRGQLPQYFVEGNHTGIVDKQAYTTAQAILKQRGEEFGHTPGKPGVFSGKIRCGTCGKNYRRKVTKYNEVWCCRTFNMKGKKYCASKVVPEKILMMASAQVLGCQEFDAEVFSAEIDHIEAYNGNILRFVFRSGKTVDHHWCDRSRRDSWTPEMREKARQRGLERNVIYG